MLGARFVRHFAVVLSSLLVSISSLCAQSIPAEKSVAQASSGANSLRIRLRLPDESPFAGSASVRVMPNEGYEVAGRTEADGEMLFTDVPPGIYIMEASAPGFLNVRQKIQIQPHQGLLTRFVVMKPKPFDVQAPDKASASPVTAVDPSSWILSGIDNNVPVVDPRVECPLPHVVRGAGQRMKEFVANLEKFTATERVEHQAIDVTGGWHSQEVRDFNYVVTVKRASRDVFLIDEYRNGSSDPGQFPAHIATQGMPAIALLFHPVLASDYTFACEGLGAWEGRSAWQVHFVQRPDRPNRILSYSAGGKYSSLPLKGRAWIDPGTFQVLRIETELVKPLPEVGLNVDHVAISYQPVEFPSRAQELWLPKIVDLYVERQGRRYYRRHTFKDFQLFVVDTAQSVQLAKESYGFTNETDRDIMGVLTVTPISGTKLDPVSLSFTIPAGGNIVKLVGPGKDVEIPVESVASATFAHNGPLDSVKVDAHLSKESTLDVISGTSVPLKEQLKEQ